MIRRLQKRYALSEQGAKDLIKGCFACVLQNISFMFPVGLLYCMVSDLMNGGVPESRLSFYIVGCILCVGLILLTTYFQYNATYFATYTESGACEDKKRIATRAKQLNLDAIHDTVHEMCKDEARHGQVFAGLYKRFFAK